MKHCKECKFMNKMANSDETGEIICGFIDNYFMHSVNDDCPFIPEQIPVKCKDCTHYDNDAACLTVDPEDTFASKCGGFEDKRVNQIIYILYDMYKKGQLKWSGWGGVKEQLEEAVASMQKTPLDGDKK